MHVEVPHSFEKLSDTSDFKAELNSTQREARERGSHDAWSWASYFHEGSLCDAETGFLRPETAKDSSGKWNIIVQTETIRQRVPIEMCRKTNTSCKKMLNCGLKSQCLQKYNYHLLMSLNPSQKHDCPFMKLYRFPSACVCHVE
ncbi:spaetzle domain-containing protein [Trichonephila clavipes]|nr:spaetzle domain-containing protein [Trichonephila clavipes]